MIYGDVTFHIYFPYVSWYWENSKDILVEPSLDGRSEQGNYKAPKDWQIVPLNLEGGPPCVSST